MPDQLVLVPAWMIDCAPTGLKNAIEGYWASRPDPIGPHPYQPYYSHGYYTTRINGCGYNGCGASQSSPVHFT